MTAIDLTAAQQRDALEHISALEAEVARLRAEALVPGVCRCPKCGYSLVVQVMSPGACVTGAGSVKGETCPSCCVPMWPVTWKDHYLDQSANWEACIARKDEGTDTRITLSLEPPSSALPEGRMSAVASLPGTNGRSDITLSGGELSMNTLGALQADIWDLVETMRETHGKGGVA